ncbi:MAG: S-layer homology domain-containing protein, partial [Clostridia bacterium]|nr:S-layer homology domain-containing protein [Clostridia bacterium]
MKQIGNFRIVYRTRLTALFLVLTLLLGAGFVLPAGAAEAADGAVHTAPAAQIRITEDAGILTLQLQLRGTDLCRTQCAALSFDRSTLSLLTADRSKTAEEALGGTFTGGSLAVWDAAAAAAAAAGFGAGLKRTPTGAQTALETLEYGVSDAGRGLLLLYPTAENAVTLNEFTTVLTLYFSVKAGAALTASSVRLFTYEEQRAAGQSAKLVMCTADEYYTYGSLNGGDTLADAAFVGHPVITGVRGDDTASASGPWVNPFTDISEDAPYYDAVAYVASAGLFVGDDQGRFQPGSSMNRATFATVLCRLAGDEEAVLAAAADGAAIQAFPDVKTDAWYAPYVAWAAENGIFYGDGDGNFCPDNAVTHEQMYALMQRFTQNYGYNVRDGANVSLSSISDADKISDWAVEAVKFAFANGFLIADTNRAVRPREEAPRWALAEVLYALSEIERTGAGSATLTDAMTTASIPDCPPADESLVRGAFQKLYDGLLTLTEKINISAFHLNFEQFETVYHEAAEQPEFFSVDNLFHFTYSQMTGEILTVTPTYTMRGAALVTAQKEYQAALDDILSGVDESWTSLEKVLYLHDTLAVRFVYDESAGKFDTHSLLTTGRGVCQGYTLVMQALLTALGIENSRVTSEAMNHTWNLVRLGGAWYHLDVIWDDPQVDQHGQAQHTFFLKSDAYMTANTDKYERHYDWYCFDGYTCTETKYDNAFFTSVRTPFVPGAAETGDAGLWYYIDNADGGIYSWDTKTGKRTLLHETGIRWKTAEGVYKSLYTGLIRIGDILLYNGPAAIFAYHLSSGVSEIIYENTAPGYICGLTLEPAADAAAVPYLVYLLRDNPGSRTGTVSRVSASNLFTYSLT